MGLGGGGGGVRKPSMGGNGARKASSRKMTFVETNLTLYQSPQSVSGSDLLPPPKIFFFEPAHLPGGVQIVVVAELCHHPVHRVPGGLRAPVLLPLLAHLKQQYDNIFFLLKAHHCSVITLFTHSVAGPF